MTWQRLFDVTSISFRFHQRDLQDFNYMVHSIGFGFASGHLLPDPGRFQLQPELAAILRI